MMCLLLILKSLKGIIEKSGIANYIIWFLVMTIIHNLGQLRMVFCFRNFFNEIKILLILALEN